MHPFERIIERAREHKRRIVLPEASDPRILKAAAIVRERQLAEPILLGQREAVQSDLEALGLKADTFEIHEIGDKETRERHIERLMQLGKSRGLSRERAEQALQEPTMTACLLVREGEVDGCVAGAITATADVVRSALRGVGPRPGTDIVSSFFIMLFDPPHSLGDLFLTADCGLVIEPDEAQLAAIATATGDTAETLLGLEPHVAMLSFSTAGSARHAKVSKVVDATALARQARPERRIIGEVQLDAAVVPEILASKAPTETPGPAANVLIFPDLDAGNLGYKLLQRFAGAKAIGPILQGLTQPVNDLSRGCSVEDIVNIVAVTAAQVEDS